MGKHRFLQRGSIQLRVLAVTLLFTLGASLVILANSVRQVTGELERSTLQSAEYALQTAASAIRRDIDEVDDLVNWCAYNASMRTWLLTSYGSSQTLSMYSAISAKYNSMRTLSYIQRFLLVSSSGRQMMFGTAASNTVKITPEALDAIPGYRDAASGWQGIVRDPLALSTQAADIIPLTRTLTLAGTSREGHICLFVSPSLITSPLKDFAMAEGGSLLWEMDGRYYLVEGSRLTLLDVDPAGYEAEPLAAATLGSSTEFYTFGQGGGKKLVVRYPVGVHGLYLLEVIPAGVTQQQIPLLSSSLPFSLLAIVVLGLALTWLLHRMIANPIRALQARIEKIGGGDFTPDPSIEWDNELGDIGRGINSMAVNVTALLDKRIEDEKQKKDLEYRMLQNQINPHFIYNTLNSIKWMATIQHAPGIAEMVTALSRLMKSVSKGNERLVPLYEEFALINDYFTIQQYRYGGTVTLEVSYIENEHLTHVCLIPRFTLQPLVENAIFHGIEPKGCAGDITLEVRKDPDSGDVLLFLTDNGVGMTAEQVQKALQPPGPEEEAVKFRHVGIWNVHRRLQYSFGEGYGLSIRSTPGVGTTVIVRLPYKESEEEEV